MPFFLSVPNSRRSASTAPDVTKQAFRVSTIQSPSFRSFQLIQQTSFRLQAAFDPRVLSAVCFFATDIHSGTLGKGGDDSLKRVQAGELTGKGELVVRTHGAPFDALPQELNRCRIFTDDIRKAGKTVLPVLSFASVMSYSQDTHVPRAGRDLIRSTLEDACVSVSVRSSTFFSTYCR